ncbi:unnamed protein product [Knipowitschia caucasica]|uniref:Small RNA 2'-O-methyltransferase n=1 Tax=Knipowitschia caucasica TaxID=637954 RepID=A0AAV2KTJ7_KNICA
MEPLFRPPLHQQRHQFVVDFVKTFKTKKVMDLGCSECSLLKKLKFHKEIEHLVGVDIDGAKVKKHMRSLAPLSTDFLQPGFEQLCVELYEGSVTQRDHRLRGFDLAVSIELIEHLVLSNLELFSEVLFGDWSPLHVIVSTPNSDYNALLPGLRGFRHPDHKFEWSREQFQSWAQCVCLKFGYSVDLTGVGRAPEGQQQQFGFCSQIAVFHRLKSVSNLALEERNQRQTPYKLLHRIKYPSLMDNNVLRRVLVSEVLFWAEELRRRRRRKTLGPGGGAVEEQDLDTDTGACGEEQPPEEDGGTAAEEGDTCDSQRCVSVPLLSLWAAAPRVAALSGSLSNLRVFLSEEPTVHLSPDGSALLLPIDEEEASERDLDEEASGGDFTEVRETPVLSHKPVENWEED